MGLIEKLNKTVYFNSRKSTFTRTINGLNTPIKRQRLWAGLKYVIIYL